MKAVVIGGGSIGKRHSLNLHKLGITTRVVDIDEIYNIDEILKAGFDFGFVCSPTIHHLDHCTKLAQNNIPIFCEKPFYTFNQNPENLLSIVRSNSLTTMVGCNMRFCPEIKSIDPSTPYIAAYFGYDLKKWRPTQDHLKSYSANKNMGGGILLDAIHEIDYLYYKFGEIQDITYISRKLTAVTKDTEDLATGTINFKNGTVGDFSVNYLCSNYTRYFDFIKYNQMHRQEIQPSDQMYIDELKYFISCIKDGAHPMNNFTEASYLLEKLL